MRLPDGLRRRMRGPVARLRGFRGNLDGEIGGALVGWVQLARGGVPRVGLYARGALLAQTRANVYRGDLDALGIGDGFAGFLIPLTPELSAMVVACGGEAEVRVISARAPLLGRWRPDPQADPQADSGTGHLPPPGASALAKRLYGDLQRLACRLETPAPPGTFAAAPRPAPPVQARLFARRDSFGGGPLPAPMFAYAEFLRRRNRLDARFDPTRGPQDTEGFFRYYLGTYGPSRAGLRIPLSAEAIAWLNAPEPPGPQAAPSRAARLCPPPDHETAGDSFEALYRWAVEQAPALHVEDCLVPPRMIARLAQPTDPGDAAARTSWPLSAFMARFAAEIPELAALPLRTADGRRDLTCALMVMALSRPDLLRYLPPASVAAALEDGVLAGFCARMGTALPGLTRAGYAHALRQAGFDLDRGDFLSLTAEGHRAEFARFAPPAAEAPAGTARPPVDLQIIGPFHKASGLGQATRLSAEVLERTGLRLNRADFDLDNPAPKGFSKSAAVSGYGPARINLFHLNAEAVPLAAAYQPDIFSGAYNIGYVFWELDSPAACHFLGMEMLDEIWVSTEFGVSMYQPWTDRPVINVGMTYEDLPAIPRQAARAALRARTGAGPRDFTFLVTFDCFSFVQRKNPLAVLAAFARAFPDAPDVRLLIKTQNRRRVSDPGQEAIWRQVDAITAADPRITLLDETLQYRDLLQLKAGADAYLSLHRSEGWGFGMIEAMNLGLPVVATGYSGNMDFCDPETCWLVDYTLTEVGPEEYIFVRPGQMWAEPDPEDAARQMRAVYADAEDRARRVRAAFERVQREFSHPAIADRYGARLRQILNRPPQQGSQQQEDSRADDREQTGR